MKTVRSALLGNRQLIDTNTDVILTQLKDIIKEHRAQVITRLVSDLPTYLHYKFDSLPGKDTQAKIKEVLVSLKNGNVDLRVYDAVVQQLLTRAVIHLTNEPFYKEIDECISVFAAEREIRFS